MKTKFIVLLLLFNIHLSYSQIREVRGQMSEELKMHYNFINKAEMAIVDSNYVLAIALYDSAFALKQAPFGSDLYNAAVCASLTKQYEKTFFYFKEILDKGYKIRKLQEKLFFADFFNSSYGEKLNNYSQNLVLNHNIKLRNQLDSMLYMDQKFRRMVSNPYEVYSDTIDKIDESNARYLLQIINHYGFPGEDIIGLDTILISQPYYILILHTQQRHSTKETKLEFTDVLFEALYDGSIRPHTAAFLIESSGKSFSFEAIAANLMRAVLDTSGTVSEEEIENSPWGYFPFDNEEDINERRQEIGLDKLNERIKKILFKEKNTMFSLSGNIDKVTELYSNIEDYEWIKERLILIK